MNKDKNKEVKVVVHGFHKSKKETKSSTKKLKSAEKHLKDIAYSRKSGVPMKGFKGLPKVVKTK